MYSLTHLNAVQMTFTMEVWVWISDYIRFFCVDVIAFQILNLMLGTDDLC